MLRQPNMTSGNALTQLLVVEKIEVKILTFYEIFRSSRWLEGDTLMYGYERNRTVWLGFEIALTQIDCLDQR